MKYQVPISVIMPCYNSAKYILKSIESILNQTFPDFELIIVNDGSTDNSDTSIKKVSDKRIKYFHHVENLGNYAARNVGLKMAKGKYVCVLDSDDIAMADRLKIQFKYMEKNPKIGCSGTQGEIIDENDDTVGYINRLPLNYPAIKVRLLQNNHLIHSSLIIRNSYLKKYHFLYNETFKYSSDYDLIVRLARKFPVRNLDQVLVKYRIHSKQISSTSHKKQMAYADAIRKAQLEQFQLNSSKEEIDLHLKLMKCAFLTDVEMSDAESWLNKLLRANYKLKLFNRSQLYNLCEQVLAIAVNKSNFRGFLH